ncbi:MAG: hypothetical protein U0401_28355 [Anaerolineae bacterium]
MNRRIVFGILLAMLLLAGVASVGVYAYNAGVAQGLVESGKLTDLPPGAEGRLYPYYGGPFWFHRPFGFGFFGCLGPLFFILLIFALLRGLMWGGPWGRGHGWRHGPWEKGVPPMFEEWHRQAHSQSTESSSPS